MKATHERTLPVTTCNSTEKSWMLYFRFVAFFDATNFTRPARPNGLFCLSVAKAVDRLHDAESVIIHVGKGNTY